MQNKLALSVLLLVVIAVVAFALYTNKYMEKFLIDPLTKCCGGRYMWGSCDSPTFKYCSDPKNEEGIAKTCCSGGCHGKPLTFEYTPETDGQWNNPRC